MGTVDGTSSGKWELCFKQNNILKHKFLPELLLSLLWSHGLGDLLAQSLPFWMSVLLLSWLCLATTYLLQHHLTLPK